MQDAAAIEIRETLNRDVLGVIEIEQQCFGRRAWSESRYRSVMRSRSMLCMVAEINTWDSRIGGARSAVTGHMVFEQQNRRIGLMRIAVGWSFQRRGIGTLMINRLKSRLSCRGRHTIEIEVPETFLDAQLFLRASDFVAVGMDRDLQAPGRDVILFRHSPFAKKDGHGDHTGS